MPGRKRCQFRNPGRPLMDDTVEIFDEYSNVYVGTECETNFHGHRVGYSEKKSENFTHIVDLDRYEFHKIIVYDFLGTILQSIAFRAFILALVLVNAILIGLQTVEEYDIHYGTYFTIIDHIILSIFIFEIMLKWAHDFKMFFRVMWNVLDFVIVLLVVVSSITPYVNNSQALLRVVRAFRSLRSVSSFSSLAIVTHTVVKSIGDMMSILFVLMIFMIVWAVMGVTLFEIEAINEHTKVFNSPLDAWLVLFVCITQDGWVDYMESWRNKVVSKYFVILMIYIVIAIAIGAFIFSNLIIAVVVANLEIGVAEIRAEKIATQNPLSNHGGGRSGSSSQTVDINTTYTAFANDNLPLRAQRPMKLPTLKHISERRLHAYIHLIVALEQNMLEHILIEKDLEKVMGVVVSIVKQLEKFSPTLAEETAKGAKVLNDLKRLGSIPIPVDPFDRMELLDDIKKIKQSNTKIV